MWSAGRVAVLVGSSLVSLAGSLPLAAALVDVVSLAVCLASLVGIEVKVLVDSMLVCLT